MRRYQPLCYIKYADTFMNNPPKFRHYLLNIIQVYIDRTGVTSNIGYEGDWS